MNVEKITTHLVKFFTDEINDANYKTIKNIIHNEAQISKEELKQIVVKEIGKIVKEVYVTKEIRKIIEAMVKNEVAKILGEEKWQYSTQLSNNVQRYIHQIISNETRNIIRDEVVSKLKINFNNNE